MNLKDELRYWRDSFTPLGAEFDEVYEKYEELYRAKQIEKTREHRTQEAAQNLVKSVVENYDLRGGDFTIGAMLSPMVETDGGEFRPLEEKLDKKEFHRYVCEQFLE